MKTLLDLGCGSNPRNIFNADVVYGIDINSSLANVITADLTISRIPFSDDYFDYVTAFDFLEHIPRIIYIEGERHNPFVELMSDIWRVLKMGGIFYSFTPAFPKTPAFSDPTHVNIITEETFPQYFDHRWKKASIYGFVGQFEVLDQRWMQNHLTTTLRKL